MLISGRNEIGEKNNKMRSCFEFLKQPFLFCRLIDNVGLIMDEAGSLMDKVNRFMDKSYLLIDNQNQIIDKEKFP